MRKPPQVSGKYVPLPIWALFDIPVILLELEKAAAELKNYGNLRPQYESLSDYKNFLSLEFTRNAAAILTDYGVDTAKVMKLAGSSDQEAEPETKVIEEALSAARYVSMSMLFPGEGAL